MRFVILGDSGGANVAFNSFAASVDRVNRALAANDLLLRGGATNFRNTANTLNATSRAAVGLWGILTRKVNLFGGE